MKRPSYVMLILIALSALAVLLCAGALAEPEQQTQYYLFVSNHDAVAIHTYLDPYVYTSSEMGSMKPVREGVTDWAISDERVIAFTTQISDASMRTIGIGKATISVTAPDGSRLSTEITVVEPPTYVMIDPKTIVLREGESVQLRYTTDKPELPVRWYCGTPTGNMQITQDGELTAIQCGVGTARVSSALDDRVTDTCRVVVLEDDNSIVMSQKHVLIQQGDSVQLRVTTKAGAPVDATFFLKGDNNQDLRVTQDGLVTAPSLCYNIKVYAKDSLGRVAEADVYCVRRHEKLKFYTTDTEYSIGGNVIVNDNYPVYGEYTFTSSNPAVLSFKDSQSPAYDCNKVGKTTITVRSNFTGLEASQSETVTGWRGLHYDYTNGGYVYMHIGEKHKLQPPRNAATGRTTSCKYYSELPQSVSVGKTSGMLTAKALYANEDGKLINRIIIYAVDARKYVTQACVELIVPPERLALAGPDNNVMRVGDICDIQPNISMYDMEYMPDPQYYPDGLYEIEYASSDPNVATVDQNGRITAVGTGEVVVTGSLLGVEDALRISVGAAEPEWVKIRFGDLAIGQGEIVPLDSGSPIFSPGTSSNYRYLSGDNSVFTLDRG